MVWKSIQKQLLGIFIGAVTVEIIFIEYLFNIFGGVII